VIEIETTPRPTTSVDAILAEIDNSLSDRILVFGSLPPRGRDVDLLIRTVCDFETVEGVLRHERFERYGDRWIRVDTAPPLVVELVLAEAWSLPASELAAVYEEARPLRPFLNVARPAPAHSLLILARKRAWRRGISAKRRARIDAGVAEDPAAWARARARAPSWGVSASLDALEQAHRDERPPLARRLSALAEALARAGDGSVVRGARKRRHRILARERGQLFAFSGLDGAGKSHQAAVLAQTLDALGRDPVVVWSPLGSTGIVALVGGWGKRAVLALERGAPAAERLRGRSTGRDAQSAVSAAQRRVVAPTWVSLMGMANALSRLRVVAILILGRDVVCDRYALDSAVHLLQRFGPSRAVRWQIALIRFVSPTPRRSFVLDVRPEVALRRKVDRWSEAELRVRAELYRDLHTRFGAIRVDGEQSVERVAEEVALHMVRSLSSP
jgi:thymidylate kinase